MDVFRHAVTLEASDVIVSAGEPPIFRVHGHLKTDGDFPSLNALETRQAVFSLLREDQIVELEDKRDLDFSFTIRGLRRFRGNVFFQRGAVGAAFRLIPEIVPSLNELGHPAVLKRLALALQGLFLVTGPTGSGKTTTLAAIVREINRTHRAHIITIEDPIEYVHPNQKSIIEQREVGEDTASFKSALRHVLRQDPDVIQIGELRDLETISTAITAAETGHLVLATLHTNDCVQTVDRMIDVFPAGQQYQVRNQLASSLLAVFNQRLIPRADGLGRVAASELLVANIAARSMIREGKTHQLHSVLETGIKDGMFTMDHSLKQLYKSGKISLDEIRRRVTNPRELEQLLR